jgi:mRNA interferase MazF
MRPAVVVSRDALGVLALRVIVPVTGWQDRFADCDWLVRLEPSHDSGLDKPSAADTFQVRSISAQRFFRRLGRLNGTDMDRLVEGLRSVLEI